MVQPEQALSCTKPSGLSSCFGEGAASGTTTSPPCTTRTAARACCRQHWHAVQPRSKLGTLTGSCLTTPPSPGPAHSFLSAIARCCFKCCWERHYGGSLHQVHAMKGDDEEGSQGTMWVPRVPWRSLNWLGVTCTGEVFARLRSRVVVLDV